MGVIIAILLLNAVVGWYQEKAAADIVSKLKADISMKANVIRNGKESQILAREIVPGDIVIVQEGQVVPADAKLICDYSDKGGAEKYRMMLQKVHSSRISKEKPSSTDEEEEDEEDEHNGPSLVAIDQSSITGESLAVEKYMGDILYYTTGCKRGKAYGIVTTPAKTSFVGRTASMVEGAKDQGHFKAIMNSIGAALLVLVMGMDLDFLDWCFFPTLAYRYA